ncbi:MAG: histidinol-phosphate aminotransferase family protein [Synergistetes bacterium]|nr:MAG: Uncharacterized protein XD52_0403 [bacterium 42_11]MBC7332095.1 histidinol-phosphate aminotransferase family protein [Synergistota bacterium]MDK2870729.1 histidinol-phosphate aminotransferase [bacterium]
MVNFRLYESKIRKSLLSLKRESYVEEETPGSDLLDCSLGQNPFGFPRGILESLTLERINMGDYPDPYYHRLRKAIVERWGNLFEENDVFIGSGSMGCLEKINKALLKEGSLVLGYSPQFTEYVTEVKVCGGVYESVALKAEDGFEFRFEELMDRLSEKHTVLYIDNPNNPTGQVIPLEAIKLLTDKAFKLGVVVVVDEAYGDFMEDNNSAINLNYPNLIVVRSFSKGFGLAGLRVGYAVVRGRELRELYSKVNLPFEISSFSEEIAIRALKDLSFLEQSKARVREIKKKILEFLYDKGYSFSKTALEVPIFLLWKDGEDLYSFLKERGILSVSGRNFASLSSSFVRIRVPPSFQDFVAKFWS